MKVIERNPKKESCFGCKHLEIKDVWRGMHVASCGKTDDDLLIPYEWTGNKVVINGIGDFCTGKEV